MIFDWIALSQNGRWKPRRTLASGPQMAGPMNFQQLETLACLARLKSFHAAAEALRTTQPSVSLRIKTLE
jgi:hypothetical protein